MRIPHLYLRELVNAMDALEQVDKATEFLYAKGPITFEDEGGYKLQIVWDADGFWCLDTEASSEE